MDESDGSRAATRADRPAENWAASWAAPTDAERASLWAATTAKS